jgi:hypothetical protein
VAVRLGRLTDPVPGNHAGTVTRPKRTRRRDSFACCSTYDLCDWQVVHWVEHEAQLHRIGGEQLHLAAPYGDNITHLAPPIPADGH